MALLSNQDVLCLALDLMGPAELAAVCRVHPYLRHLAVYSSVTLTFTSKKVPQINLFLRTILHRPDLAVRTRELSLSGGARLPYRDAWVEGLQKGALDAYTALVVSQLPRLRVLRLGPYRLFGRGFLGAVLGSILCLDGSGAECAVPEIRTRVDQLHSFSLDCFLPHQQGMTKWYGGSLRALTGIEDLTKLTMPIIFFTGFMLPARRDLGDCLPCNLEELKLTDQLYDKVANKVKWGEAREMTRVICYFLERVESFTPRLRKLLLLLWISRWHDRPSPEMDTRQLAGHAGIEFQVLRTQPWPV
ncbi:hypothetical protein C8A05DRAFT_39247 [Staphylotrichum tortipilum]|uniref:Uncharacterized protein n=1 Tax=Staphylotrichum tortipilum TaxID=2831512 RepID=A0AAN6MB77_9PEZI|nr:hypothetical protein C8A05DRAFT_39247 [Staphylotrichum longicolle]